MVDMGYQFRIYPNQAQRQLIERTFGCTRWVWNHFLNKRQVEYEETGRSSRAFKQMKDLPKLKDANPWLREVDSVSLQAVLQHLDRAYDNFYRRVASKKKGGYKGTTGYPRFKGKHNKHQSYTTKNVGHTVYVADDKHVRLPKLGMVKAKVSRPVTGVVKSATVSRNPTGEYYVTIKCTGVHKSMAPAKGDAIGIDLGLKDYCITSEEVKHPNHRYLKQSEKRLRREKRKLSRKPRGGNNREKQRIKVAKLEQKVARQRRDTLDKLSTCSSAGIRSSAWKPSCRRTWSGTTDSPNTSATRPGASSRTCSTTRPDGTGAKSSTWTGSIRPASSATTADTSTRRSRTSKYANGHARNAVCSTTGMSTRPTT